MPVEPSTSFDPALNVRFDPTRFAFQYGPEIFGPKPEYRRLDDIRRSLRDPGCTGPDPVYAIAMDVGRVHDAEELRRRMLLFGVVAFAAGTLGDEPVRSQGHVHTMAPHCGWSTPELFEIWEGRAVVYAQESTGDTPGRCIAIEAGIGEQVVVPPAWGHAVINATPFARMVFGAWCDRQYGFAYDAIRAHGGLAWFPVVRSTHIEWERNPAYHDSQLVRRRSRDYPELGVLANVPIYLQFVRNPESVQWVSEPARYADLWRRFEP
jgi:glucose-6-phosphate isomerase, archaeal